MRYLLRQLLDEMKGKVVSNLEEIKKKESVIRELLQAPYSHQKNISLERQFISNKELLAENMDYLELQIKIVAMIDKYKNTDLIRLPLESIIEQEPLNIDFFTETIDGRLAFNEYHPNYNDEYFINRLLAYYLEHEKFEECKKLVDLKIKIKGSISL
jgi:hypothetical protein